MSDAKLGSTLTGKEERDAVHVAILPVQVEDGQRLFPGQPIGIVDGKASAWATDYIGIVDPFLTESVSGGDWFYACLYPGSITSLRHDWTHPVLAPGGNSTPDPQKRDAERWLRRYAVLHNHYDSPDEAFDMLIRGLREGTVLYVGEDMHSFGELEDPEDLKRYASIYLGTQIDWDNFTFSCTC